MEYLIFLAAITGASMLWWLLNRGERLIVINFTTRKDLVMFVLEAERTYNYKIGVHQLSSKEGDENIDLCIVVPEKILWKMPVNKWHYSIIFVEARLY